ncbi:hypothetical protein DM02DRAFT_604984 [Periconia macrospinosa]|uniref:Uncharacterized protein n=1 Tax=Periconia macrospinosa TaxID=97972 RepID=A0A2V1D3V4_9PLEO|nr:hypothetical protein DM02DRAFT_604984 [Periconia macrospinosa]
MPIDSNRILHTWIKYYKDGQSMERMPSDPNKHELLGFPGVEAKDPKVYIRKLWLPAENDRVEYPKFWDTDIGELAKHTNRVVNEHVKDDEKRHKDLCSGAFLKAAAEHILHDMGYGQRIWCEDNGAEARLKSVLTGPSPRWGVMTDAGQYEKNDEEEITLNLRYWMAARIQAKTNAPCKEKRRVPATTEAHIRQTPQTTTPSYQQRSAPVRRRGSQASLCGFAFPPSPSKEHRIDLSMAVGGAESYSTSNRSGRRTRSNSSEFLRSSTSFACSSSRSNCSQSGNKRVKRSREDIIREFSHPQPSQHNTSSSVMSSDRVYPISTRVSDPDPEVGRICGTSTDMFPLTITSTNDADPLSDSFADDTTASRKLQPRLGSFLSNEPEYSSIVQEVILPTKQLYALSHHRQPHDDLYVMFRGFNQALDHWGTLITRFEGFVGAAQSPCEDPLQHLIGQMTFKDRVAAFRKLGLKSQTRIPFEEWTMSLALLFEGLLGHQYMPFPFEDLVIRLRAANQSLYDSVAVSSDQHRGESVSQCTG